MWTNYHTHTNFCDGNKSIAEVVDSARELKMFGVGLSSHAPLPFGRKWSMKTEKLAGYLAEIEQVKRLQDSIEVYAGLEADYIPGKTSPALFRKKLDYVIGSIHFVDEFADGQGWEIDGPYQDFLAGYERIFQRNMKAVVLRYLELTRQMVLDSSPDIVGHIDKIKMQNKDQSTFSEDDSWYKEAMKETLSTIRRTGRMIEINTRGLYQGRTTTTYPSPWVINEIGKQRIPVTLSSDAHDPRDLVNRFPDAARILLQAGIKKIRILSGGKWTDTGFDEHGIKDYKVAH